MHIGELLLGFCKGIREAQTYQSLNVFKCFDAILAIAENKLFVVPFDEDEIFLVLYVNCFIHSVKFERHSE